MLQQIAAVGKRRIAERRACRYNGWFEREFVLEEDLEVELLDWVFDLLGDCFVGLVSHG
jgi:hypothetical protein